MITHPSYSYRLNQKIQAKADDESKFSHGAGV